MSTSSRSGRSGPADRTPIHLSRLVVVVAVHSEARDLHQCAMVRGAELVVDSPMLDVHQGLSAGPDEDEPTGGSILLTTSTGPSSSTTRLPVCGWNATLSYMARSSLPVMKRSTVGMVPVAGVGSLASVTLSARIGGELLQGLRVSQNDIAVGVKYVQTPKVDLDPRANTGLGALPPVGRFGSGHTETVDIPRGKGRHSGYRDRAIALKRNGRDELVNRTAGGGRHSVQARRRR
jgi:hypothetical protein